MVLPLPEKPSIAVLPFDNLSGDASQDYLADGMTEDIITSVSQIDRLFVIARNSTFVYKNRPVKVQEVAEELGVRYVLEGSVQKAGGRLRITAQLIDALTGRHMWGERYDRDETDLFVLQDEIADRIVVALQVELTEGEQVKVWRSRSPSLDAWRQVSKGMVQFHRFNRAAKHAGARGVHQGHRDRPDLCGGARGARLDALAGCRNAAGRRTAWHRSSAPACSLRRRSRSTKPFRTCTH